MFEYKLMNREELTDYILEFWLNWGVPEYEGTNEQLYSEIYDNLGTKEGIERELDTIRIEFESGYEEESKEYQDLDKMWNYINWYKTSFYENEKKKTRVEKNKKLYEIYEEENLIETIDFSEVQ